MKRTLILLAGPPATGKSYLILQLRQVISDFFLITPDEIKEMYADKEGFLNLTEKSQLEKKVWQFYYNILNQYMTAGKKVIVSEYPFSDKQKAKLKQLSEENGYQVITIRLTAEFALLWQRRKIRDLENTRHLSHLMTHYQDGDELIDRSLADNHITKKDFHEIIEARKYNEFELGKLIEIDVNDFSKIDYEKVLQAVIKEL